MISSIEASENPFLLNKWAAAFSILCRVPFLWSGEYGMTSPPPLTLIKDDLEHLLWPVTILSTVEFGVRWGKTPPRKHPGARPAQKVQSLFWMSGAGRYATNR